MKKIEINVIDDILKSRLALHDFGLPVKKFMEELIPTIKTPTLIIINIQKANPMDYEFVNISFNEIVKASISNPCVYVVFKVDKGEFDELCTGIIDILDLRKSESDSEQDTLKKSTYSMVYIDESNVAQYLSSISADHINVLKEIECNKEINSSEIQEKLGLISETNIEILNDLIKNKFIIKIDGAPPKYMAISSFI